MGSGGGKEKLDCSSFRILKSLSEAAPWFVYLRYGKIIQNVFWDVLIWRLVQTVEADVMLRAVLVQLLKFLQAYHN